MPRSFTHLSLAVLLLAGALTSPALAQEGPHTARWIARFGSDRPDGAAGVASGAGGGSVVAGTTDGVLPGATSAGDSDVFVAAFDASGRRRWLRQFGSRGPDRATAVALDAAGNAYVSGFTANRMPLADSVGAGDAFLAKLDPSGALLWLRQFGTSGADYARSVAVDGSGNVYVGGDTNGTLAENRNLGGDGDAFVAKFDASGDLVWQRQFGGPGADRVTGVSVDGAGDLLATGVTTGALPTNRALGQQDGFLAKLTGNGVRVWLRQFGSEQADFAYGVAAAPDGGAYVTGYSYGSLPGNASSGNIDAYLARFDASGNRLWFRQFGHGGAVFGYAVARSRSGTLLVGGWADQDPLGGGSGRWRAFLASFDASGKPLASRTFATSGMERPLGVALAPSGEVLVATGGVLSPRPEQAGSSASAGSDDALLASYPP